MGFAASLYNFVKMALIAEEVCKGKSSSDKKGVDNKELNLFQWGSIRLNLPGTDDPSRNRIRDVCQARSQPQGIVAATARLSPREPHVNK